MNLRNLVILRKSLGSTCCGRIQGANALARTSLQRSTGLLCSSVPEQDAGAQPLGSQSTSGAADTSRAPGGRADSKLQQIMKHGRGSRKATLCTGCSLVRCEGRKTKLCWFELRDEDPRLPVQAARAYSSNHDKAAATLTSRLSCSRTRKAHDVLLTGTMAFSRALDWLQVTCYIEQLVTLVETDRRVSIHTEVGLITRMTWKSVVDGAPSLGAHAHQASQASYS